MKTSERITFEQKESTVAVLEFVCARRKLTLKFYDHETTKAIVYDKEGGSMLFDALAEIDALPMVKVNKVFYGSVQPDHFSPHCVMADLELI